MKKYIFLLIAGLVALTATSQTGTGVVLLTDASYLFTATTVDSTTTVDLQLVNTVGVEQTVYFGGLEAPFGLTDNTPQVIPALDTLDIALQFQPTSLGAFSDTLTVIGGIFGSAELVVSGTGIQVVLEWDNSPMVFDTTAIGQTSEVTFVLNSTGNGDGAISQIDFSDAAFSVDSAASSFVILEGSTDSLTFVFAPSGAGQHTGTATLHTNDPNNQQIILDLSGLSISEVSGEICDMVWTAANSPYTLVGDVVVPEGCTLTLQAGVEILGEGYNIIVKGDFIANGTSQNQIEISVNELVSHSELFSLEHCIVNEFDDAPGLNGDLRLIRDQSSPENLVQFLTDFDTNALDSEWFLANYPSETNIDLTTAYTYFNNFTEGTCDEWTSENTSSESCNGNFQGSQAYCGCWTSIYLYSPTFLIPADRVGGFTRLMGDLQFSGGSDQGSGVYGFIRYKIEDQGFNLLSDYWYGNNTNASFDVSLDDANFETDYNEDGFIEVQFQFFTYQLYSSSITIDNFQLFSGDEYLSRNYREEANTAESSISNLQFLNTGDVSIDNCEYNGDIEILGFQNTVNIESSSIQNSNGGISIYSDEVDFNMNESEISNQQFDGLRIWSETGSIDINETSFINNFYAGLNLNGNNNVVNVSGSNFYDNALNGIELKGIDDSHFYHCMINSNGRSGLRIGTACNVNVTNSVMANNNGYGVFSLSRVNLNYVDLVFNNQTGFLLLGNNFNTLNNSILWGNNSTNYTQIDISGGVLSTSYSTVQGQSGYGVTGSGQFYWGEGVIEADPLFADDDLHLNTYSPCVDGGQPWLMDAHMPYGLGGVRADMGMYGGPDNGYWGGLALPDGASTLMSVQDSPQDQGNTVGLTFSSSFYDNNDLVNNVTHYSFWRHYDPTGEAITDVAAGNWELLGDMTSLSLANYAYQAPTLGNTNAFGTFSSCYFVAAHTDDDDTYWISNVACGEAVDNLAPEDPDLNGLILESGEAQLSWPTPAEEDYAYTEIFSDYGFSAEIGTDTLVIDDTVLAGNTYTYTAVNYDVNGNASETSTVTLTPPLGLDIIPLQAGWNLISTDRIPADASVEAIVATLEPNNLDYMTGFDANGVQFYDPNGFTFLNSLSSLANGHGYWVRVQNADTLEVSGNGLPANYLPALNAGWNIIGYPNNADAAPADYFADFITDGSLEYVTGFNGGSTYFDPNGLSFLNSLVALENGFGYWMKVTDAFDPNGMPTTGTEQPFAAFAGTATAQHASPNFMLVNGTSDLTAGQHIDVLNAAGEIIAYLPVLDGGFVMTTALFGDDPSTPATEGLTTGEALHFAYQGQRAEQHLTFEGQMALRHLDLTFGDAASAMNIFPNPFVEACRIEFEVPVSGRAMLEVTDLMGRTLDVIWNGQDVSGMQSVQWTGSNLAAGSYTLRLIVDGAERATSRIIRQ